MYRIKKVIKIIINHNYIFINLFNDYIILYLTEKK